MIPGHIAQAQALFGQPATHSQWQTKLPSSTQRAVCDFLQSWRNAIGLWIPLHRRTPSHATMENWGWQAREGCMSRLWTWVPTHRKTGQKSDECHSQRTRARWWDRPIANPIHGLCWQTKSNGVHSHQGSSASARWDRRMANLDFGQSLPHLPIHFRTRTNADWCGLQDSARGRPRPIQSHVWPTFAESCPKASHGWTQSHT